MAGKRGAKRGVEAAALACVLAAPRPLTAREVIAATGYSENAVRKWLGALALEGKIARIESGRSRVPDRYAAPAGEGEDAG